jgi:uncharacterized protein YndB with AHSA1/START domain
MMSKPTSTAADREIVIRRRFDAARDVVFDAWTQPDRLMRWWAPAGCTTSACTVDLRPGGAFHFCMRMPGGPEIWGLGIYREIVAPERIVYTDTFADAQGRPVPPSHYGMSEGHPAETLVEVTFDDDNGGTLVTLRHSLPAPVAERDATAQGWSEMFDRLAQELARR